MTQRLEIEPATAADRDAVIALWERCGLVVPHNPPGGDFDFALGKPGSDVLVGRLDGSITGAVMVGHDGHRGWIYYLAVDPDQQGNGLGAQMVEAAEEWLRERHVRKVQLMVRETNQKVLDFYRHVGYERATVTVMQRWLDPDQPGAGSRGTR